MINNVTLVGRLTRDVELKTTQSGTIIANYTVAVNRNKEETDFINCVSFNKTAEVLNNYTSKGALVGVSGKIQVDQYEKDGQKRTAVKVNAFQVQLLEPKKETKKEEPKKEPKEKPQDFEEIDVKDSDLPF